MSQIRVLLGISLFGALFTPSVAPAEPAPVAAVEQAKEGAAKVEEKGKETEAVGQEVAGEGDQFPDGEAEISDEEMELEFNDEDLPEDLEGEEQNMTEVPQAEGAAE